MEKIEREWEARINKLGQEAQKSSDCTRLGLNDLWRKVIDNALEPQ